MPSFRIEDLHELIKTTHESQNNWRKSNWEKTLKDHNDELENLLKKINTLNLWSNKLQRIKPAEKLIPEIFIDTYMSLHLACFGLYKYAHMCLRSGSETVLRLVFFSTHPVEFEWWSEGSEWYIEGSKKTEVWGPGYEYFTQLRNIKEFDRLCDTNKKILSTSGSGIRGIHKKLSKFIHSGAGYLQTRVDRLSPEYNLQKFKIWIETAKKIQEYINIILILGFPEEFKDLRTSERKEIIDIGIEDDHYIEKLNEMGFNAD